MNAILKSTFLLASSNSENIDKFHFFISTNPNPLIQNQLRVFLSISYI